jgi:hypothetical protein
MAFSVRITLTKDSADLNLAESLAFDDANDVGIIPGYIAEHGGSVTRSTSDDGLVSESVYTFPTQADWQAFYNQALPVWNRNNLANKAGTNNVTIDFAVVENT